MEMLFKKILSYAHSGMKSNQTFQVFSCASLVKWIEKNHMNSIKNSTRSQKTPLVLLLCNPAEVS